MNEHRSNSQAIEIAPELLIHIVGVARQTQIVELVGWQTQRLTSGREVVSSLYRVDVQYRMANDDFSSTTLVLKVVRMTPDRVSPLHWNYWRRETEAYKSKYLATLPANIAAPRCFGVTEHADAVWIWLEHIPNHSTDKWLEEDVRRVAFELGTFNGAYLSSTPLPSGEWVSHQWLRNYVNSYAANIEQLPDLQSHPLVGRSVSPHLLPDLLQVVKARDELLNLLDEMPQVFVHLDAHQGNIFLSETDASIKLIAVDWSFAGIAAVGQETAPLIFTNRRMPNIFDLVTHEYLTGLRLAGWQGDEMAIMASSAASVALTYGVAMVGMFIGNLLDERQHAELTTGFGSTIEQLPPKVNAWVEFGLHYAALAQQYRK